MKAWANVRLYTRDASLSAKSKLNYNVCSEAVRLVLEYTQECDYIWFEVFVRIHEYLEDCIRDCSLAIWHTDSKKKTNPVFNFHNECLGVWFQFTRMILDIFGSVLETIFP